MSCQPCNKSVTKFIHNIVHLFITTLIVKIIDVHILTFLYTIVQLPVSFIATPHSLPHFNNLITYGTGCHWCHSFGEKFLEVFLASVQCQYNVWNLLDIIKL